MQSEDLWAKNADVPEALRYAGRTRRPSLDRFSAILNFGYALLQTAVMRAILACGLEPALGFYHTPRSAAHPLVLDLMELFRCPLWDLVVIGSLNRGQWQEDSDFTVTRSKVWLSEAGRKKAIGLFEDRLRESWKHPVVNLFADLRSHDRAGSAAAGEGMDGGAWTFRPNASAMNPDLLFAELHGC